MKQRPVVLMILDGYGLNDNPEANAIAMAKTPVVSGLMENVPFVKGYASGMAVGLPDGQMGNSEVGHMNMGAGRIVYQELTRITKEIQDGEFFENPEILDAINNCKVRNSDLHIYGLLSDGGVHSHITHLYAILEMCKRNGLDRVYVDCFLDGRDTPPQSGIDYIAQLEEKEKEIGVGQIAMISGRYYAMDRDNNYDRVQKAYDALTKGEGLTAESAHEAITASYERGEYDEFASSPLSSPRTASPSRPSRTEIPSSSSISALTERERSRTASATTSLTILTEAPERKCCMSALRTMIRTSRTRKWPSRRSMSPIRSASGWPLTA